MEVLPSCHHRDDEANVKCLLLLRTHLLATFASPLLFRRKPLLITTYTDWFLAYASFTLPEVRNVLSCSGI